MTENTLFSFNPIQAPSTAPRGTLKKKKVFIKQINLEDWIETNDN